jgi:hypothetical protein
MTVTSLAAKRSANRIRHMARSSHEWAVSGEESFANLRSLKAAILRYLCQQTDIIDLLYIPLQMSDASYQLKHLAEEPHKYSYAVLAS